MYLVLAGIVSAMSLLAALYATRRHRALAEDLRAVRNQLRDLSGRLANAEKSVDDASSRADAAGSVLLEKGLANKEELEAARRRSDLLEEAQPARGSRTLH